MIGGVTEGRPGLSLRPFPVHSGLGLNGRDGSSDQCEAALKRGKSDVAFSTYTSAEHLFRKAGEFFL